LDSGNYSETDYEGVYELYLAAYGDEDEARKAQSVALQKYVDSKVTSNVGA